MNRRDFLCGATCLMAGFALGKMQDKKSPHKGSEEASSNRNNEDELGILIAVSSHCNLNCKGCHTFSPLAEQEFVTFEQFEKDFRKLKEILGNSDYCLMNYSGGEALLNPELEKIMELSVKLFPKGDKALSTNAILLEKKNEDFYKLLKRNNIHIFITKYPINIDRSKYENLAKKYNIELTYDQVNSNKLFLLETKEPINDIYREIGFKWGKPTLDLEGNQKPIEKQHICPHRGITTYARGNLYACYTHAFINAFIDYFKVDIPITEDDYLKIENINDKKEIFDFLNKPKPLCRYCKYCHNTCYGYDAVDWDFSKKEISEWTE